MTEKQDSPDAEETTPSGSATLPRPPLRPSCERLSCHKSSVCSRSYFVVVMVFFHVYIINVIALLLYVHYSNGQEDASRSRDAPSSDHQRPESGSSPSKPEFLRDVHLTRIEGIRVSNVMMPFTRVYSSPDTPRPPNHFSLYPVRWDMSRRCHWYLAECMTCGLWAWNLCCLVRAKTPIWLILSSSMPTPTKAQRQLLPLQHPPNSRACSWLKYTTNTSAHIVLSVDGDNTQ